MLRAQLVVHSVCQEQLTRDGHRHLSDVFRTRWGCLRHASSGLYTSSSSLALGLGRGRGFEEQKVVNNMQDGLVVVFDTDKARMEMCRVFEEKFPNGVSYAGQFYDISLHGCGVLLG
jgi:hypothetical protein